MELGLMPMSMASKTGKLWRKGACANRFLSVQLSPPAFTAVPLKAAKEHFVSLFGIDTVFTGCSRFSPYSL